MSKINAVLSFLSLNTITNTPAVNNTATTQETVMKMKTIPAAAPVKKNAEDSILLLAAKAQRQARQIQKLEANAEFDDACIAAQGREIAKLRAQVEQLEALQTLLVRNALLNDKTAKANAAQANKLANELEVAQEATLIANSWVNEALCQADRQARLANAFRNIARSNKGRVSSKFALPIVEGEVEAAELAYFDRLAIDQLCDQAEAWESLEAPLPTKEERKFLCEYGNGACRLCRRHKRRGHRQGKTTMSAREVFHYLNR